MPRKERPNFIVILIDDLRFDEFGAGGHPYMKTPHIDRIAHEGVKFDRAFHLRAAAREHDARALADNVVTILKTVKNMTQPDIMALANNAVAN